MSKALKELPRLVIEAKRKGFKVSGGTNGGGWHRLANALGYEGATTKLEAKVFVRQKILEAPGHQTISEGQKKASYKARQKVESKTTFYAGDVTADEFLSSFQWRKVRMQALLRHGATCQCCGSSPKTGSVMNVDHVKPRKLFPALALDINNLQVLCHECNHGKGNWDMTDWREKSTEA